MRHNASRVRVLLTGTHNVMLAQCCRCIEAYYPGNNLLPNLRRYHLSYQVTSPHQLGLVGRIAKYCPDLRVFALVHTEACRCSSETGRCAFVRLDSVQKMLSDAIQCCRSLTEVRFSTYFNARAIIHLSRLPNLTSLGLHLHDANCAPLAFMNSYYDLFPALSVLEVGGSDATQLTHWLRALRLPSLTTLAIAVFVMPQITAAEALIDAVSCFSGLQRLCLRFEMSRKSTVALKYPASEAILRPLFRKLPLVADFALSGLPCNPLRKTIFAMSQGWPGLRKLRLHRSCYTQRRSQSRIPLGDLLLLAHHCPSIETIAVPLNRGIKSGALSVYKKSDFEGEGVTFDPVSGHMVPPSLAHQYPPQTMPPSADYLAHVVEHTPLPVSNLRNLELSIAFREIGLGDVAKCLAAVFPHVQLTQSPENRSLRQQSKLEASIPIIMNLKAGYVLENQAGPSV